MGVLAKKESNHSIALKKVIKVFSSVSTLEQYKIACVYKRLFWNLHKNEVSKEDQYPNIYKAISAADHDCLHRIFEKKT